MKTHALLTAAFLLCAPGPALAAPEVLETITAPALFKLMKAEGYAVSVDKDGDVVWKLEGYSTFMFVDKDGDSLTFRVSFKNEGTTLAKVNDWNRAKRFSQSFLDEDGDPCLQSDLELNGGITRARLTDYFKTCQALLRAWTKEVL
ncbi:MAG: YbjN domain-containing protein [Candidatus Sericytochromatia bacterium]|nr:YbjN domain-containing protein [Candidatus Sericytochromatia bacterium]